MPDDDDPSSRSESESESEPGPESGSEPPPKGRAASRNVVRLRPPFWFLVVLALGLMLSIRIETTTDYVGRGRLELLSIFAAALVGVVAGVRFVRKQPDDGGPLVPWRIRRWRFIVVVILVVPVTIPAANGFLAVINRVGIREDVVRVECTATRLESRARFSGGERALVRYWCRMPDGQSFAGRAPEELPAEVGKPIILPSVRGRLGVWIRVGAPEPR